jgi:hypothetical protein
MMTAIRTYAQQGKHRLQRLFLDPRIRCGAHIAGYLLRGFLLSAASLGRYCQPLPLSLLCASSGWLTVVTAIGSGLGYWLFWGKAGLQGILWLAAGLPTALLLSGRPAVRTMPFLLPAIAGVITAAAGLTFQLRLGDTTPIAIYFLRILLAFAVTYLFLRREENQKPFAHLMRIAENQGVILRL